MADITDFSKVYLFLSQRKDWVKEADSNGDGTIIKYEFSNFMKSNYDFNNVSEDDQNELINKFWAKFDTNRSGKVFNNSKLRNKNALDSKEIDALNNKVKVFEALNEYISKLVAPNCVDAAKWKSSVSESLTNYAEEFVNQGKSAEELTAYLDSIKGLVSNKTTANLYAQNVVKNATAKFGYNINANTQLQGIISNYVLSLSGEEDIDTIKNNVDNIINTYLATAGLCDNPENPYDLGSLGYNGNTINELQKEVIIKTIKNDLSSLAETYKDYPDELNSAIESFIEEKISNGGTFEELKASASEFSNSKWKTNLDNMIDIDKYLKNLSTGSEFYNALEAEFGTTLAELIAKNARYIDAYKSIISDVKSKLLAGTLTKDDVQSYIIKQISENLSGFLPSGLKDLSLDALSNLYDKMAKAADEEKDDDKSLKMHREAAITYCDAIAGKSSSLKAAVEKVFGSDYKSEINNEPFPYVISTKIATLKANVKTIGDIDISKMTEAEKNTMLSSLKDSYQLLQLSSNSNSIALPCYATCNGTAITSEKFSYSCSGGNISIDDSGIATINTSKAGTFAETITILIDGQVVATKTIKFTIIPIPEGANSWGGGQSEHLEVYGLPGVSDGQQQLTSQSFADLYKNNATIMLHMVNNANVDTEVVKARLKELCEYIVIALIKQGLDPARLSSASDRAITALMRNYREGKNGNFESNDNTEGVALGTRCSNKIRSGGAAGVNKYVDKSGKRAQVNMVSFKEVVDLILKYY